MQKTVIIEHKDGFASTVFILQGILLLIFCSYFIYAALCGYITGSLKYILLIISPLAIYKILVYLSVFYRPKKYILSNSSLRIDDKSYNLDDIALKYFSSSPGTLLAAEIVLKENDKRIGMLIVDFWAGSILNIQSDTLDKIFDKKTFCVTDGTNQIERIAVDALDMSKEAQEIKRFDIAWYLVYVIFIIPLAVIWYLMAK